MALSLPLRRKPVAHTPPDFDGKRRRIVTTPEGLTLPFLSYGGNSLLVSCFMVAILVRIQYEHSQSSAPMARRSAR